MTNDSSPSLADVLRAVAHDLRSPLMRLRFSVELARSPGDAAAQLDRADREISRIDQLLEEAQGYARLEEQLRCETPVPVSVAELLASARREVLPEAARRQIRLELGEGPDCLLALRVQAFRLALVQALRQALSAVPDQQALSLHWSAVQGGVAITLVDRSGVVSAALLEDWLQPLRRDPRQCEPLTLGFGHAMLARVVREHGGRIAASAGEGGVVVEMVLPLAPA
jgi:two-component system sensor histidine kinase CpxA